MDRTPEITKIHLLLLNDPRETVIKNLEAFISVPPSCPSMREQLAVCMLVDDLNEPEVSIAYNFKAVYWSPEPGRSRTCGCNLQLEGCITALWAWSCGPCALTMSK